MSILLPSRDNTQTGAGEHRQLKTSVRDPSYQSHTGAFAIYVEFLLWNKELVITQYFDKVTHSRFTEIKTT